MHDAPYLVSVLAQVVLEVEDPPELGYASSCMPRHVGDSRAFCTVFGSMGIVPCWDQWRR